MATLKGAGNQANTTLIARRASDVMTQTNKLEWWMILKISLKGQKRVFLKHL